MSTDTAIADHYSRPDLIAAIEAGLARLGKSTDSLTIEDLAVVDEFHTGGRAATEAVMGRLGLTAGMRVLDVGCGVGGPARYCAAELGCDVTGIDLTPPYIEAATAMTEWVGLSGQANFQATSARDLAFDQPFDAAYLFHVGMNVEDKPDLFSDIAAALRPGGRFAVYDLMRSGPGDLNFPLPWSSTEATSWVVSQAGYEAALAGAGFHTVSVQDHSELARNFVAALRDQPRSTDGPPPLGLHLLMGPETGVKVDNILDALDNGTLTPVEIISSL